MKKLIALSLGALLVLGLIGCGKEKDKPSDSDKIGASFQTNEWFTSIGETSRSTLTGQTPVTYGTYEAKSGWNFIGDGVWKRKGSDSSTWNINIPSPGHANIPINLWWYDTLFVVYDSAGIKDTVAKPAPVFRASITFYYKNSTGTWEFEGLNPAEAKADSAHPYVKIDSVKVENLTHTALTYPTLKDLNAELFAGDSYPYTFHKNDLVKVKVFESGIDTTRWMLIFAPAHDTIPGWFGYNANLQCWEGTWQVRRVGCHWCWIDELALSTILDKDVTNEREMLWGVPYKVIE